MIAPTPTIAAVVPPSATRSDTSSEPSASPSELMLSSTPKIRPSTWGDPVRCSSVRPETSKRLRPMFATASSTSASAIVGQTAISATERP